MEPDDLLKFGMIPEFIGRFPVMATLHPLSRQDLAEILVKPKNALIKQYMKFFEMDNVKLTFTDDAMEAIANEAYHLKTGARGLRSILEDVMLEIMYEIPSQKDIAECVINKECIVSRTKPACIPRDDFKTERKIA